MTIVPVTPHGPRRPAARLRRTRVSVLSALVCLCSALAASAPLPTEEAGNRPMRIGFTRGVLKHKIEADLLAAMRVWATTLATERKVHLDPEMRLYQSGAEAQQALRDGQIDAVTAMLEEYSLFPRHLVSGPFFRHQVSGRPDEEFVVLTRKDHHIDGLEDLRGTQLAIHDNENVGLASAWFAAQLADAALPGLPELFDTVDHDPKLSRVVLGVFFGKYDSALVTRHGFLSMAELNPQVAKQLRILVAAPPIIPSVFCFRRALADAEKVTLLEAVLTLHESVTGEQILRVFKSDRMSQITADQLDQSLALLQSWRTRSAATREPSPVAQEAGG